MLEEALRENTAASVRLTETLQALLDANPGMSLAAPGEQPPEPEKPPVVPTKAPSKKTISAKKAPKKAPVAKPQPEPQQEDQAETPTQSDLIEQLTTCTERFGRDFALGLAGRYVPDDLPVITKNIPEEHYAVLVADIENALAEDADAA